MTKMQLRSRMEKKNKKGRCKTFLSCFPHGSCVVPHVGTKNSYNIDEVFTMTGVFPKYEHISTSYTRMHSYICNISILGNLSYAFMANTFIILYVHGQQSLTFLVP